MARRKIIWSHTAKIKLFKILDFYTERNQSAAHSKKLYARISKHLRLLLKDENLGIKTDIDNVRALIDSDFIIFYEPLNDSIFIHTIWDCRQNPKDLVIK